MENKKSIGLRIFGIFYILVGLCCIVLPLIMYGKLKGIAQMMSAVENLAYIKYFAVVLSPVVLLEAFICFVIGTGVLRGKYWAWYLMIASQIIGILGLPNRGFIFGWESYGVTRLLVGIGLPVFTLWFFTRPNIREQFKTAENKFILKNKF